MDKQTEQKMLKYTQQKVKDTIKKINEYEEKIQSNEEAGELIKKELERRKEEYDK